MFSFDAIPIFLKNKKIKSSPSVAVLSLGRSNDLVIWAFPSSKLHSTMIREHLNCHGPIKKGETKQAFGTQEEEKSGTENEEMRAIPPKQFFQVHL